MGCAGSARLQVASATGSLHRTPTPVKREIEVQTISNTEPICVETEVHLEKKYLRSVEIYNTLIDTNEESRDTEESLDKPELPTKSDTVDNELGIKGEAVKEDNLHTAQSAKYISHESSIQVKSKHYNDDKSNNVRIEENFKNTKEDSCTLDSKSITVNSQELSEEEEVDSTAVSPSANEVDQQVRHWLNTSLHQQNTSSPKQSCRETRWEALADVVSELPPRLAVDSVTGQIYTYVSSHPAPRRPPPPPLPPS